MENIIVTLTVRNEEERIEEVLYSLRQFETVVVFDKQSTDDTRRIAEKMGAIVYETPNDDEFLEENFYKLLEIKKSFGKEWVFSIVASDLCHYRLHDKIIEAISSYGRDYDMIEIPYYWYSMGLSGKHSYYNKTVYQGVVTKISSLGFTDKIHMIAKGEETKICRLRTEDEAIAIYHLTHENLETIMERHIRYAKVVGINRHKSGRKKERELRSCLVESLRLVKDYFTKGMFHLKWDGMAQFFMLLMYFSMCYLNTYFDEDKEKEIADVRREIFHKSVEFPQNSGRI